MRGISIKRKTLDEIRTTLTANSDDVLKMQTKTHFVFSYQKFFKFLIELSYVRREKDYRKDSLIFFEHIPNAVFFVLSDFKQNTIKVSRKQ